MRDGVASLKLRQCIVSVLTNADRAAQAQTPQSQRGGAFHLGETGKACAADVKGGGRPREGGRGETARYWLIRSDT